MFTIWPRPIEPLSEGNEIYNFKSLFLSRLYFNLSLSDLCLISEEKKILTEIMRFYYMTYLATL